MFKHMLLAISIAAVVGCSTTNQSYDTLYDKVAYKYDNTLNKALVSGPIETPVYTAKQKFDKFTYDMGIENSDTYVNLDLKYRDSEPRSFYQVIDTTGRVYPFTRHEKVIVDCGVSGSSTAGVCVYTDSITFKMPDDRQSQFILVGRPGHNASFKVNKEYIAVMSDITYRLKTPRADSDELRVKKNTLLTASPKPLEQKSVTPPQPVVKAEPTYQPVVSTVPVQKPITTAPVAPKPAPQPNNGSYIDKYKVVETCQCSSSPQSSSTITSIKTVQQVKPVVAPAPVKKPVVTQPAKKTVLTPVNKDPFCSNMVFKTCGTVSNCREAYDQLACGNKKLDPSNKGMPCPNVCKL